MDSRSQTIDKHISSIVHGPSSPAIEITDLTGIATLQDLGRRGWNKFGVPASGPMDWFAHRAANQLLDNHPNAAVLEIGMGDAAFRALRDCVLAVTGAGFEVENYVWTFPLWTSFYVRAGWRVHVKKTSGGNWAYLAIAGGFDSPVIMGSRSTYLRGGLGQIMRVGEHLQAGKPADELLKLAARNFLFVGQDLSCPHGTQDKSRGRNSMPYTQSPIIEVIPAPQSDWFTAEGIRTFYESEYTLSPAFDRMGYRLELLPTMLLSPSPAKAITKKVTKELISEGMTLGSIQIPADGQPIVMMADAPTTGGYPKIANVTRASLPLLAQCEAGVSRIRFRETTTEAAQENYYVIARSALFATKQSPY
ncbi:MAG: KipI antagonist [Chloroflexi bacterium]|nr:MAG: biotin-dependent carboxyltransferase [Chloroflexota bacterium]MCQ3936925.1 KipI antagonist [Chloroflexota bacterium]MDL1942761.1 biotin-dependent carboxyltransferase family protein [Chloroflexi bacterium CFX2]